jgi:hypothetical protein
MSKLFGPNWKTSCSAICSFLMITGVFVSGYISSVTNPASWEVKLAAGCTFLVGLLKVWIGFLMYDAGSVQAMVPGSSTPQTVPSHEVPDNPSAQPTPKN